ncbi:hypothetical protein [Sphingomonas sp. CFBP8993]|nr:hypothetical protein [Sphingomonas sp. CFBP8993]
MATTIRHAQRTIRLMRRVAGRRGGDPRRIGIPGMSAGGDGQSPDIVIR